MVNLSYRATSLPSNSIHSALLLASFTIARISQSIQYFPKVTPTALFNAYFLLLRTQRFILTQGRSRASMAATPRPTPVLCPSSLLPPTPTRPPPTTLLPLVPRHT